MKTKMAYAMRFWGLRSLTNHQKEYDRTYMYRGKLANPGNFMSSQSLLSHFEKVIALGPHASVNHIY